MSTAELKLEFFRKIDNLDAIHLKEALGLLDNYIKSKDNTEEWEKLTVEQQNGIKESIREIQNNEGIPHSVVMEKNRNRYND